MSDSDLKGKVAIVTGGSMGIGKGIADALARHGAVVAICCRKQVKSKHYCVECDVSNFKQVQDFVGKTVKKYGRVDILVNNAGVYPFTSLKDMTEQQWDQVMDINLKGVFNCTKAVLPFMTRQKHGKIVSIASIAGVTVGFPGLVHYCASKAGIAGFTKAAALELAPFKINVNAVAPGAILTPGVKQGLDSKAMEHMIQQIPEKRMGKPVDIAETVAFLASEKPSYITGPTIAVEGGWTEV